LILIDWIAAHREDQASGDATYKGCEAVAIFGYFRPLDAGRRGQASVHAIDKVLEIPACSETLKCEDQSNRYDCDDQGVFNDLRTLFVLQKGADGVPSCIKKLVHLYTFEIIKKFAEFGW
jgi:hypothetical protein